jgi:hypothetical protein
VHLNGIGNRLWAQATNFLWGLGKSGTSVAPDLDRDVINPASGQYRIYAAVVAGASPSANIPAGYFMSNVGSAEGALLLGGDRNCYVYRGSGTLSIPSNCGPLTVSNSMTATSYNAPLTTPASSSAACTTGTVAWDTGFVYVCTATNTWKRAVLSTF